MVGCCLWGNLSLQLWHDLFKETKKNSVTIRKHKTFKTFRLPWRQRVKEQKLHNGTSVKDEWYILWSGGGGGGWFDISQLQVCSCCSLLRLPLTLLKIYVIHTWLKPISRIENIVLCSLSHTYTHLYGGRTEWRGWGGGEKQRWDWGARKKNFFFCLFHYILYNIDM